MAFIPGDAYSCEFTTQRIDTGFATDADTVPSATAVRNGNDDAGTFALTVTRKATGDYKVTGTIPTSYAAGDSVQVRVQATVNGVIGKEIIDSFTLDGKRVADLYAPLIRALGLSQDNWVLDGSTVGAGPTYDSDGKMLAGTIYLYDNAAHTTSHDGATGLIGKYTVSALLDGDGNVQVGKQIRVS
jgi:hypothetical protein